MCFILEKKKLVVLTATMALIEERDEERGANVGLRSLDSVLTCV